MNYRKAYIEFIAKYIGHNIDAHIWILGYGVYVHAIDDIIDGDKTDSEFILKTFELAAMVYSYPFYLQNMHILYSLCKTASNTYMDSVLMEKSKEEWKRNYADILRTHGNEVILAVIEILHGIDVRRKASQELREISYHTHHNELGAPI